MRRRGVVNFSVEIRTALEEDYTKGSLQILHDICYGTAFGKKHKSIHQTYGILALAAHVQQ